MRDCHVVGVEAEVVLSEHLGQHRRGTAVPRGGGGRDEGDAGHDHLVAGADAGGQVGQMQRGGAARHGHGVRHAQVLGVLALELLGARTHGEPAGAQRVGRRLDLLLGQLDIEHRYRLGLHRAESRTGAACG